MCSTCGSKNVLYNSHIGEIICRKCGLVIEEYSFDMNETPKYSRNKDQLMRSRFNVPSSVFRTTEAGTFIGWQDLKRLPEPYRYKMIKVIKRQPYVLTSTERNFARNMKNLKRLAAKMKVVPFIEKEAARIYKMATQASILKGRSAKEIIAASLYAACKLNQTPRPLGYIEKVTEIGANDIAKSYKFLIRKLKLKIIPDDPIDHLGRIRYKLKLKPNIQTKAIGIIEKAKKKSLITGKNPVAVAAASMYLAAFISGYKVTQRDVAKIARVSEVTIRNRYKELIRGLNLQRRVLKIKTR